MAALAPWASDPQRSRGRRIAEAEASADNLYQSDRERIVHCTAFRRLVYKTQVFINHEGDLFRTRLTHSLEVAQLARSLARALQLNEDLVEAIALAHDLGHTPFGHAGQDALHECMREHGGFEHNLQSLRVVDTLEQRYPHFDGLNLSFETREGILKHCSRTRAERLERDEPNGVGRRFIDGTQPSLEAQLVNLADEMAYSAHDIDDGVRSGLITAEQLRQLSLFQRCDEEALALHPQLNEAGSRRLLFDTLRRMLALQADDVVASTRDALQRARPADADAVRAERRPWWPSARRCATPPPRSSAFSSPSCTGIRRCGAAPIARRQVVGELFAAYVQQPSEMPPEHAGQPRRERAVADYIAGMTDRFALREHQRLTGRVLFADAA